MKRPLSTIVLTTMAIASVVVLAPPALAIDFTLNSTLDKPDANPGDKACAATDGKCTLRAAVMEIDALGKPSSNLKIPSGTYTLTISGSGEDHAATGDLDLRATMNISATSGTPVIKGGSGFGDRIFDIPPGTSPAIYMTGLTISNGSAPAATQGSGGGIRARGGSSLILQNITVKNSTANGGSGGGVYVSGPAGSTLTVNGATGLTLTGNSALENGGGLAVEGGTVADVKTLTVSGNSAEKGAGVSSFITGGTGSIELRFSTISDNATTAGGSGGGLAMARAHLSHLTVSGNSAAYGGGLRIMPADIPTVIEGRVALDHNTATVDGGGLYVADCGVTCFAADLEVDQNTASGNGGGIYVKGGFTLTAATLYRNVTSGQGSKGGAIYHGGPSGESLSMTNVTITENGGGPTTSGFVDGSSATDRLTNVTIAGNTGGTVKGVALTSSASPPELKNVVVASSGTNCSGSITSLGHNLDSGNSCGFRRSGDIVNTDPELGLWTDTGGFTRTMRPVWGSPVIDAGHDNGCPRTDQRVVTRPQDGDKDADAACDIGAYEISQWVRNTAIQLSVAGDPGLGSRVTYTMELTSTGGDAESKTTVITDVLPGALSFVSCVATGGGVCGGSGNTRTVTWSGVAIGATKTATIVANILEPRPALTIVNTVRVSSDNPDLWAWDNTASATVTI